MIDESESLLNHCDEETMEKKDIEILEYFDLILKHSKKLIFMDGDMSQRSLGFASSYGRMTYVNNKNNETKKSINVICNQTRWEAKMHEGLEKFDKEFLQSMHCKSEFNASCKHRGGFEDTLS